MHVKIHGGDKRREIQSLLITPTKKWTNDKKEKAEGVKKNKTDSNNYFTDKDLIIFLWQFVENQIFFSFLSLNDKTNPCVSVQFFFKSVWEGHNKNFKLHSISH